MADNVPFQSATLATPAAGETIAADDVAGVKYQVVKLDVGANGASTPVVGALPVSGPLTDAELRAVAVPVSGTVAVSNLPATQPVSGPLTDVQLRATAVSVSGPLTDAQLRAVAVPVSGTVTANAGTNLNTSALALEAGGNLAAAAASLAVMDDWDEADRAKVNPIVGQAGVQGASGAVTALTQRVVLATDVPLPAGTNNIGDVDVLSVPRSQSGPGQPGTAIDSYTHASINLAAGADQVLVASAPNKQIWVYGIGFVVSAVGTVSFQDEDNIAITGIMPFAANSGMAVPPSGNFSMPIWKLATDKDLEVDVVTAELDGWLDYAIVSV